MHEVRSRQRDQRRCCGPFRAVEPPERAHARRSRREHERDEQSEPDDASVREVLQRDAVRLDDVARVQAEALPRDLERAGARTLGPVVRVHVERLLPPAQAQIRIERPQPARVVDDLGAVAGGRESVGGRDRGSGGGTRDDDDREGDQAATDATARPGVERPR